MKKVIFVLTSHDRIDGLDRPTGFYFDELATPYYLLLDSGYAIDIASIKGGQAIHDPSSLKTNPAERPAAVQRFLSDTTAMSKLAETMEIGSAQSSDYAGIFLPGGHGTMYDFPENEDLARLVGSIYDQGGVVGAVCHGPAGLVNAKRADGQPIVAGRRVNSFTNAEEDAAGLTAVMPFLLEDRLKARGAIFHSTANFTKCAVTDGRLVTGQNPMSAEEVGLQMIAALDEALKAAA